VLEAELAIGFQLFTCAAWSLRACRRCARTDALWRSFVRSERYLSQARRGRGTQACAHAADALPPAQVTLTPAQSICVQSRESSLFEKLASTWHVRCAASALLSRGQR
jgi:hypothetical protein